MSVQIVHFTTAETDVPDVEAAIEVMVAAIHREGWVTEPPSPQPVTVVGTYA